MMWNEGGKKKRERDGKKRKAGEKIASALRAGFRSLDVEF